MTNSELIAHVRACLLHTKHREYPDLLSDLAYRLEVSEEREKDLRDALDAYDAYDGMLARNILAFYRVSSKPTEKLGNYSLTTFKDKI